MQRPCGTWPSPYSAASVAAQLVRLSSPLIAGVDGADVVWLERRPQEGGRGVLVCRRADGAIRDVTPPPFNVRTRVHEYGGGASLVSGTAIWFSHFADDRLYALDLRHDAAPTAVTPPGPWRYADLTIDPVRRRLVCVREDHGGPAGEPVNALVSIALDDGEHPGEVLAEGADFYASPRINPAGTRLAWLSWSHPSMPWDGTELWMAEIDAAGALRAPVCVAGGPDESIYQPGWSPDGTLYFVSDRTGWWQIYCLREPGWSSAAQGEPRGEPVMRQPPAGAEFGRPQWVFGTTTWAPAGEGRLAVTYTAGGRWRLATVDVASGAWADVPTSLEPAEWIAATPTHALLVAGSPDRSDALVRVHLVTGAADTLREASDQVPDPAFVSRAVAIEFPSLDGERVHAFFYPPTHPDCTPLAGERPPLVAICHGGPTGATRATFDVAVQFWTSRGFAVVDVNYRGSSGYGRAYRQRLDGSWGVVDVADMVAAVQQLARERADAARLVIRGGSAGGYTALAALAFHPGVFAAAASYYGVSDLEVLARDTHKFESRYLERLVGPYPEAREIYRTRSPLHAADRIACGLILFQGLEDRVVPPNQSEMMAAAVRANGWPVEYLAFEGEQHGFRRAETIIRCLEAELAFYAAVLRLRPDAS